MSVNERLRSPGFKALGIALLALLMLFPLSQVRSLISERQALQLEAQGRIASGIGGVQRLGGPVLSIPAQAITTVTDEVTHDRRTVVTAAAALRVLPRTLNIDAVLGMELRHKGIYSLPTYLATIRIRGEFDRQLLAERILHRNTEDAAHEQRLEHPEQAVLLLPVGDLKSLRSAKRLEFGAAALQPSSGMLSGMQALSMPLDLTTLLANGSGTAVPFAFDVIISGSDALNFLPLAAATTVMVQSTWPHPDYQGAFLPVQKMPQVDGGFKALWSVLQLNRAIAQSWYGDALSEEMFTAATFGVRLMQPSTVYSSNERAVRYGILFIAITFIGFFGWEHLSGHLRLHTMHYLLVGLALAVFYLLLLALSEHLGFALAYLLAASALVLLIVVYVAGVTGSRPAAALNGGLLSVSYGLLYVILQSEDYALLLGSLLLFATLAALMVATRKLDWRALVS